MLAPTPPLASPAVSRKCRLSLSSSHTSTGPRLCSGVKAVPLAVRYSKSSRGIPLPASRQSRQAGGHSEATAANQQPTANKIGRSRSKEHRTQERTAPPGLVYRPHRRQEHHEAPIGHIPHSHRGTGQQRHQRAENYSRLVGAVRLPPT